MAADDMEQDMESLEELFDDDVAAALPSPDDDSRRARGKSEGAEYTRDKHWRVPRRTYEQGGPTDDAIDETLRELEEKREDLGDF